MIRHELKWSMLLSLIHTGLFRVYILLNKREVNMAGYWPSSLRPRRSRGP